MGTGALPVSVLVGDDVGVKTVHLQTSGTVTTSQIITVTPAAMQKRVNFTVQIPGTVELGTALVVTATAVDTQGQATASAPVTVTVGQDQTTPMAVIMAPTNNSLVEPGKVFSVTVESSDNRAVTGVAYTVTGTLEITGTLAISPAAATISTVIPVTVPASANGNQTVTVKVQAIDSSHNRSAAQTVTVKVKDIRAPLPTLILPAGTSEVIRGKTLAVTVNASDEVGVASVGIRGTGALTVTRSEAIAPTQTSTSKGFLLSVPMTVTHGSQWVLIATATDAAGNLGTTQPITLTVVADEAPTVAVSAPAVVESAKPLTVTVVARDDQGIKSLVLNSSGAVVSSQPVNVSPVQTVYTHTFVLNVPADAAWGSTITLNVTVTDSRNQSVNAAPQTVTVNDATRPVTQITSHNNNAKVNPGSTVNVTVKATDNGTVARIDLATTGGGHHDTEQRDHPAGE